MYALSNRVFSSPIELVTTQALGGYGPSSSRTARNQTKPLPPGGGRGQRLVIRRTGSVTEQPGEVDGKAWQRGWQRAGDRQRRDRRQRRRGEMRRRGDRRGLRQLTGHLTAVGRALRRRRRGS